MPALMYQVIVPCWTRLWRLANPYIFIAIDSVFTVRSYLVDNKLGISDADRQNRFSGYRRSRQHVPGQRKACNKELLTRS